MSTHVRSSIYTEREGKRRFVLLKEKEREDLFILKEKEREDLFY